MNATDVNATISQRLDELTQRLDRLEASLPPIASRAVGLSRATAHRLNSVAADVANDVGSQIGRLSSTASSAFSTTAGQARSAADRTSSTARQTTKESVGQARAQSARTARAAQDSAAELVGDAATAIDPKPETEPLVDRTKAELYELAQEMDIEGRSSMSKADLVRAIGAS